MINLPNNVRYILNRLVTNDYSASVVGGAVRDSIMGRPVHDWDITTSAKPEEVMDIFKDFEIVPTGLQHGTVTIMINGEGYEVTTYRHDGDYSDGRRPDSVSFTNNIVEDLKRRDFTVNAIAYNPWHGFIDPFNGKKDIENEVIRCVGNPYDRFKEDGLRIMRAIRFASQLGFVIEEDTSYAIHDCKHMLDNISKERIQGELVKILSSRCCGNDTLRHYEDIMCEIIPEIEPMIGFDQNNQLQVYDLWEHVLHSMDYMYLDFGRYKGDDIIARLAILLHDIAKPQCNGTDEYGCNTFANHADASAETTYKILRDLKFSNEIVACTTQLVRYHMELDGCYDMSKNEFKSKLKRLLNKIGEEQLKRLLLIRECNYICGTHLYFNQSKRRYEIAIARDYLDEIILNNECYSLKQLAVSGDDLIERGVPQGKEVGTMLNVLLGMVMDEIIENDKEKLLKSVYRIAKMYNDN